MPKTGRTNVHPYIKALEPQKVAREGSDARPDSNPGCNANRSVINIVNSNEDTYPEDMESLRASYFLETLGNFRHFSFSESLRQADGI